MNITIKKDYIVKKDYRKIVVEPRVGVEINENHVVFEVNDITFLFMEQCNGEKNFIQIIETLEEVFYNTNFNILYDDFTVVKDFLMSNEIIEYGESDYKSIIRYDDLIIPDHISYEITNVCQLRCKHCFNSYDNFKKNAVQFTDTQLMRDLFKKCKSLNVQSIFLTGGECQLHPEFEGIIKHALSCFNRVTVATNGYQQLSNMVLNEIKGKNISFQISIDGNDQYHDYFRGRKESYKKALDNIKNLCKVGIEVQVAYTLHSENISYLEDEIIKLKDIGVVVVNLGNVTRQGNADANNLQPLLFTEFMNLSSKIAKKYSTDKFRVGLEDGITLALEKVQNNCELNKCGAGVKIIHIKPNFSVVPCPAIYDMEFGEKANENLLEIMNIKNIQQCMKLESPTQTKCAGCELEFQCGGCIANMLEEKERGKCHYE